MNKRTRTTWGALMCIAALTNGTGATAAAKQRMAVTSATGSNGATTFLQSSASGSALQGEVAASPQTHIVIPFGVLGEYDASGSKFGAGVLGISTTGYGVGGESFGTNPSVIGLNASGGDGADFYGEKGGYGIYSYSDSSNSIASYAATNGRAATYSEDDSASAGFGESGVSESSGGIGTFGGNFGSGGGIGVFAESEAAVRGLPSLQAYSETDGTELFDAGVADTNTGNVFSASTVLSSVSQNLSGGVYLAGRASSDFQINGDIYLTGAVYTNCNGTVPYATAACADRTLGVVRSNGGSDYEMYASEHASKTVEDEGEAVLRGGVAHITLDPAFASVISQQSPYLVFTTPLGDTRGLYVTDRTASSFDVRETGGGHSSLTFDYRILAHPYADRGSRMSVKRKDGAAGTGRLEMSPALAAHEKMLRLHGRGAALGKRGSRQAPAPFVTMTSAFAR